MTLFPNRGHQAVLLFTVRRARVAAGVYRESAARKGPVQPLLSRFPGGGGVAGSGSDLVSGRASYGGDPAPWWGCDASLMDGAQRNW